MTKLAIIYYSATGHGTAMAERIAKAAEAAGAEVRVRHIPRTAARRRRCWPSTSP